MGLRLVRAAPGEAKVRWVPSVATNADAAVRNSRRSSNNVPVVAQLRQKRGRFSGRGKYNGRQLIFSRCGPIIGEYELARDGAIAAAYGPICRHSRKQRSARRTAPTQQSV